MVKLHLYWKALGIKRFVAEDTRTVIAVVEVETLDKLEDDGRGMDGSDLIVKMRCDVVHTYLLHH